MFSRVLLDIGHGGPDPGISKVIAGQLMKEHDVAGQVVRDCATLLCKTIGPERVKVLERPAKLKANEKYEVDRRGKDIAKESQDTIVVSVHMNGTADTKGAEAFFHGDFPEARVTADKLLEGYCTFTGIRNRGARPDTKANVGSLGIIRQAAKDNPVFGMNVFLLELGFLTDLPDFPDDKTDLDHIQEYGAEGLTRAIVALLDPSIQQRPALFPDLPPHHFARPSAERLHELGILRGHPDGTLRASEDMLRMIVLLDRFSEKVLGDK
jgi:hypothetical protein